MGCTLPGVPAKQPVKNFKNGGQNITTDRTPHSVKGHFYIDDYFFFFPAAFDEIDLASFGLVPFAVPLAFFSSVPSLSTWARVKIPCSRSLPIPVICKLPHSHFQNELHCCRLLIGQPLVPEKICPITNFPYTVLFPVFLKMIPSVYVYTQLVSILWISNISDIEID